jgi:hypothetical protein
MTEMSVHVFLTGAIAMSCLVIALFFLRFWRSTGDRFFIYFSLSFALEALLRIVMALMARSTDESAVVYLVRLLSYCLILLAIVGKNRHQARSTRSTATDQRR